MRNIVVKRMRGQALVLLVVFVAVLAIGVVLVFDTGQATKKKVRLTNAADAAAYSLAVQQARALNFSAYMNRVRVANEVTIAQGLSLWSFLNMAHSHTTYGLGIAHIMKMAFPPWCGYLGNPVWCAGDGLHKVYDPLEEGMSKARKITHSVLTAGDVIPGIANVFEAVSRLNGIYASAASAMLSDIAQADGALVAREVVKKNDPDADFSAASLLILADSHIRNDGFLEKHEAPAGAANGYAGMDRFRNVVMATRDKWAADRGLHLDNAAISIGTFGGTDMVTYDRWAGMDVTNVGALGEFNIVLGHGGAQALESGTDSFLPGVHSGGESHPRTGAGWYSDDHKDDNNDPYGRNYSRYGGVSFDDPLLGHVPAELVEQVPAPAHDAEISWGVDPVEYAQSYAYYCRYHEWRFRAAIPPQICAPWRDSGGKVPSGNLNKTSDAFFEGYQGLQPYHDVNMDWARSPEGDNAGPKFTAYVVSNIDSARTSEHIDGIAAPSGGQVRLEACEQRITAIATGQAYFSRPHSSNLPDGFKRHIRTKWEHWRTDDVKPDTRGLEKGNTFSPYWQARLVETPKGHKIEAEIEAMAVDGC